MRIGIFGTQADAQCQALAHAIRKLNAQPVVIEADAFERGEPLSFVDDRSFYRGENIDDLQAFFLRYILLPNVPVMQKDDQLVLHADWYVSYMQARERSAFFISWLLMLTHRGIPVVNPPHAASVLQFKPFQLHALRSIGAKVPRTLISNEPARIRAFHAEVRDVIFKPLLGGALTRALDEEALAELELVTASPVIFQERIRGDDVRVTLVGDEIVSAVAIEAPQGSLDYRAGSAYRAGQARYREITLPPELQQLCRRAARECGLSFTGIDLKATGKDWVFLELNSSPMYLEIEERQGHPITARLAAHLVDRARAAVR